MPGPERTRRSRLLAGAVLGAALALSGGSATMAGPAGSGVGSGGGIATAVHTTAGTVRDGIVVGTLNHRFGTLGFFPANRRFHIRRAQSDIATDLGQRADRDRHCEAVSVLRLPLHSPSPRSEGPACAPVTP